MAVYRAGTMTYNYAATAYGQASRGSYTKGGASKTAAYVMGNDSFEPSAELIGDENLSASSGKDELGIARGAKENSFVITFSDSAIVSRAVKRGYITVNGTDIALPDSIKQKMKDADTQAEIKRQNAFFNYIAQHNAEVAAQQAEVYSNQSQDQYEQFKIAMKIMTGGKVSRAQEQKLARENPQLYAMAKAMSANAGKKTKYERDSAQSSEPTRRQIAQQTEPQQEAQQQTQQPQLKSYAVQLTVTMGEVPSIGGVGAAETGNII